MTKGPEKTGGQYAQILQGFAPGLRSRRGALCYPARMRRLLSGMAVVLLGTFATAAPFAGPAPQSATARAHPSAQTALDRYVAAPDANFTWKVVRELPAAEGVTATLIEMTSQQWLTDKEVERPLWTHWITVVRPDDGDERHRPAVHRRRQQRSAAAGEAGGLAHRRGARHRHGNGRASARPEPAGRSSRTIRHASPARKTTSSPTRGTSSCARATRSGRRVCR